MIAFLIRCQGCLIARRFSSRLRLFADFRRRKSTVETVAPRVIESSMSLRGDMAGSLNSLGSGNVPVIEDLALIFGGGNPHVTSRRSGGVYGEHCVFVNLIRLEDFQPDLHLVSHWGE